MTLNAQFFHIQRLFIYKIFLFLYFINNIMVKNMDEQGTKTTNGLQNCTPVICSPIEMRVIKNNNEVLRFINITINGVEYVPLTEDKEKSFKNDEERAKYIESEIEKNIELKKRIDEALAKIGRLAKGEEIQNNLVPILVK